MPSGESYGGDQQAWRKVMVVVYRWVDGLVTCRLTACTLGSALVPTLGNENGKNTFLVFVEFRFC